MPPDGLRTYGSPLEYWSETGSCSRSGYLPEIEDGPLHSEAGEAGTYPLVAELQLLGLVSYPEDAVKVCKVSAYLGYNPPVMAGSGWAAPGPLRLQHLVPLQ